MQKRSPGMVLEEDHKCGTLEETTMTEKQKDNRQSKLLSSPKWVRAFLGDQAVVDSRHTKLLRSHD
jgi:hypothetical protein